MSRRHLINSSDVFVIKGFTVVNLRCLLLCVRLVSCYHVVLLLCVKHLLVNLRCLLLCARQLLFNLRCLILCARHLLVNLRCLILCVRHFLVNLRSLLLCVGLVSCYHVVLLLFTTYFSTKPILFYSDFSLQIHI